MGTEVRIHSDEHTMQSSSQRPGVQEVSPLLSATRVRSAECHISCAGLSSIRPRALPHEWLCVTPVASPPDQLPLAGPLVALLPSHSKDTLGGPLTASRPQHCLENLLEVLGPEAALGLWAPAGLPRAPAPCEVEVEVEGLAQWHHLEAVRSV